MATRFARVTVVADERAVDVSLPADRPVVELLPQLRDLLSLAPNTAGPWALSTTSAGALDPHRSLAEAGIVDADRLYLTPPPDAPVPPVVDDVVDEVQATVDHDGSEWAGEPRLAGTAALAGVVVVALALAVPFMTLHPAGVVALLADIAGCAMLAGVLLRGHGGQYLLLAAVPAWTLAGSTAAVLLTSDSVPVSATAPGLAATAPMLAATAPVLAAAGGLAGAGLGCAGLYLAGERWQALAAGGVTVLPFGLLAAALLAAGLGTAPVAAILAILVAFAAGLAPQLALARSRLVHLLRAEEDGQQTSREEVAAAIRRGQHTLTGAVAGIGVVAAAAATVLVTSHGWAAVTLGAALALAFALRSRAFTRTGQVWPMLLPATVAGAAAAIAVPRSLGASPAVATWVAFAGPLLLILVLVLASQPQLGEVGAARLHQLLDLAEIIVLGSLVPLAIVVAGGFDWVR